MSPTPSPPTKTSHLPAARHETLQYRSTRERPHDLYDHNGLLSVHAATRYSKLFPVVEATARTLGRSSLDVVTEITKSTATCDWDPTHTEYIVVGPLEIMRTLPAWFPLEEINRIQRTLTVVNAPLIQQQLIWTDERNAAIDAFELNKFLFEP
jgi:hypothetical protein